MKPSYKEERKEQLNPFLKERKERKLKKNPYTYPKNPNWPFQARSYKKEIKRTVKSIPKRKKRKKIKKKTLTLTQRIRIGRSKPVPTKKK
jgi:hypothetical protein